MITEIYKQFSKDDYLTLDEQKQRINEGHQHIFGILNVSPTIFHVALKNGQIVTFPYGIAVVHFTEKASAKLFLESEGFLSLVKNNQLNFITQDAYNRVALIDKNLKITDLINTPEPVVVQPTVLNTEPDTTNLDAVQDAQDTSVISDDEVAPVVIQDTVVEDQVLDNVSSEAVMENLEDLSIEELKERLTQRGISFHPNSKRETLLKKFDEAN